MIMIGTPFDWRPEAYNASRRRQIVDNKISQAALCRFHPSTVSRPHQEGYRPCVMPHLDIRRLSSDSHTVLGSESQMGCGFLEQAKLRLAATALVLGPMRTDVYSVQPNSRCGEPLL